MQMVRKVLLSVLVCSLHASVVSAEVKENQTGYEAYSLGEIYVVSDRNEINHNNYE